MRSEDVFAAGKKIGNRFLLCRVASVSAHRLQRGASPFTESINKSLRLIASMSSPGEASAIGELRMSVDQVFMSSVRNIKSVPLDAKQTFEPLLETVAGG
jgi:hypothetical protein